MNTGSRLNVRGQRILFCAACVLLLTAPPLAAVDFIRGDANGDGVVSIADVVLLIYSIPFPESDCVPAFDFNNDGRVRQNEALMLFSYLYADGPPPAAPFPDPGPDTTSPPGSEPPCERYGGGLPVVDPAAKLEVLDAIAPGGEEVHAILTIRMSNSVLVGGFSGKVRIGSGVVEDALYRAAPTWRGVEDLRGGSVVNPLGYYKGTLVKKGVLEFGIAEPFAPGEDVSLLRVTVCLEPGTLAGEYPLTFEAGELVMGTIWGTDTDGNPIVTNADLARVIQPSLVSGTLTVLEDVRPGNCQIAAPWATLDIAFQLLGATAGVGGDLEVPLVIHANRECQGFGYAIAFDPEFLEFTRIERRYPPAGSIPYPREETLTDELPQGILRGAVMFPFTPEGWIFTLPPHQDHQVLVFHFLAKKQGSTEVRFLDEQEPQDPIWNRSHEDTYWKGGTYFFNWLTHIPGNLFPAFVTTGSRVNVLPDNILFLRGDSNGDDLLDLSDAQNTLNYIFLGGRRPRCLDAADANDDGLVDVSDPIVTLQFLFLGQASLVAPFPALGEDPTPDGLPNFSGCYRDG